MNDSMVCERGFVFTTFGTEKLGKVIPNGRSADTIFSSIGLRYHKSAKSLSVVEPLIPILDIVSSTSTPGRQIYPARQVGSYCRPNNNPLQLMIFLRSSTRNYQRSRGNTRTRLNVRLCRTGVCYSEQTASSHVSIDATHKIHSFR